MSFSFTVSRNDVKTYFSCPKKIALRVLGFKARERVRPSPPRLTPSYAIGISGEKLTEEILEIIANLQADTSRGEYVEVYEKRKESISEGIESVLSLRHSILEKRLAGLTDLEVEKFRGAAAKLVEPTIDEASKEGKVTMADREKYLRTVKESMKDSFLEVLGELIDKIPKMKAVYKQLKLRNKDVCSFGYPDFQLETVKGSYLIEVKNWENLTSALREGETDLFFYNSLLADRELGDSVWRSKMLPRPAKSLLVVPRHGVVKEYQEPIPNFRDIATEIWKIKRAALVEGKLPDVTPEKSVCNRCGFRKFCSEGESLESAKPIPIIYAVAEDETKKEIERIQTKMPCALPTGFCKSYLLLKKQSEKGEKEAEMKLDLLRKYRIWAITQNITQIRKEEIKARYKAMPNEFNSWGGLKVLEKYLPKITNVASSLFPTFEKNRKRVLRIAKRRWNI